MSLMVLRYGAMGCNCGFKQFTPTTGQNTAIDSQGTINLNSSELQTAQMTRAIAIQQMYIDLSSVAQIIVNNDPQITTVTGNNNTDDNYSLVAKEQFGVPYTKNGVICNKYGDTCTSWGPYNNAPANNSGVMFNGSEFFGAIAIKMVSCCLP